METRRLPLMYGELAGWFHLLSAPDDYAEEAAFYTGTIAEALGAPPRSLLELGSGGGNNAWHYKRTIEHVVLSDLSAGMLELSRQINPELEHVQGDMRSLRLGREFDAVFVHDALDYLTSLDDLRAAMETTWMHCRPGGVVLLAPDHVRENFATSTDHGGHDGPDGRALRYLEWTYDPDPADDSYSADYVYVLHEPGQPPRTVHETHVCGLFDRADWLRQLSEVGFSHPNVRPFEHSEVPSGSLEVFVATRPG
jgi:SAM-dependent methyltransferase